MKKHFHFLLTVLLACTATKAHAVTRSWTNTAGGNWFIAANWSPNGVPTGNDIANITNTGTYTVTILTGAVTVASVNLGAATGTQTLLNGTTSNLAITNTGTVRPNGMLTITNGGLQGNVIIQAGGQLELSGGASKNVYALTLINLGTVNWSGGNLQGGSTPTTVVSNGGLWQITADATFYNYWGNSVAFTNAGTLRKSAGSGTTSFSGVNLVNQPNGLIDTLSGTFSFNGAANSVLGGALTATTPGILTIIGGTWTDAGATASGTGTNQFTGGIFNLRTNPIPGLRLFGGEIYVTGPDSFQQAGAITNLTLEGSQLRGTNRVSSGTLTISSGGVDGQLTILPTGQLNFPTPAAKNVYALTLINLGTVNWSGGNLQGGGTPTTVVSNGGLWQITADATFYNYWGNSVAFTNAGTLRKSAGSGTTSFSEVNLINQPGALVDALNGTFSFNGGSSNVLGGSLAATSPGLLNIIGGTWTDAGGSASGTGTNRFSGGTLNLRTNLIPGLGLNGGEVYVVANTFQQSGAITNLALNGSQLRGTNIVGSGILTINSGGADGQLTILPAGQLSFPTSTAKNVYSLRLINLGTVSWNGGNLQGGSTPTTIVSNGGLWQITADATFYNYWGNTVLFTNTGTLRKFAGSGITSFSGMNLFNQPGGLVDTLSGTFSFNGAANSVLGGSWTATSPGIMTIAGGTWTDAGGIASGTGTNRFSGGVLNLRTNIVPGLGLNGGEVYVVANSFQEGGAITNLTLHGSQLRGTNIVGSGTLTVNSGGVDGQLTILPAGQLNLATAIAKNVYSLTLINGGTVNWSGGHLQGGSTPTTVVSNGGLWQVTTDHAFYNYWGNTLLFTNAGTLRKSAGSGTATISAINLVNQPGGVLECLAGTLSLVSVNNSVLGGSLTATAPGRLNLAGGVWTDAGGSASGSGTNQLTGGTLNLRTNIIAGLRLFGGDVFVPGTNTFQQAGAITNLLLEGSQLRGTNRVGSGALTINAGGVDGLLTVLPTGQLNFSNAVAKNVYSLTLVNQGTVNWAGGNLQGGSTPTTVVSNGGLWQVTTDNTFYNYWGNTLLFTNAGTLRKSAGTGTANFSGINFVDLASSVIQSDAGILQLPSPITNTAGLLRLNGGTIQSGGTYGMTGGLLEGAGAFGANAITGGEISPGQSGPGLIGFRSGLNLAAGATLTVSGTGTVPGTQYDQLSVTGAVVLANATLQVASLPSVAAGTTFMLILNDGADAVTGTFNGLPDNAVVNVNGQPFRIRYAGGSGNDVTLVRDSGSIVLGPALSGGTYSGGTFQIFGAGSNGVVYSVQATTNFVNWTPIGSATGNVSGSFFFNDTNAFRYPYRFYRTMQ